MNSHLLPTISQNGIGRTTMSSISHMNSYLIPCKGDSERRRLGLGRAPGTGPPRGPAARIAAAVEAEVLGREHGNMAPKDDRNRYQVW